MPYSLQVSSFLLALKLSGRMLGCSRQSNFANDPKLIWKQRHGLNRLSRVARDFYRSTEDLCKSTPLYKIWDQRQMIRRWRHAAWAILRDHNVLCAIWLDDVLAFHGAELRLGNYHLVVHSPQVAAGILSLYGYRMVGWKDDRSMLSGLHCQRIKMSAPGAKVDVVLLSASEWCYDLSYDALHDELCPYLPEFIDAMIELWLRVPPKSQMVNSCLMNFLTANIHECYKLNDFGDDVCENDYSIWLRPHHREVHFDIVARSKGLVKGHLNFQSRHKYHLHKANLIKQGRFTPKPRRKKRFSPYLPSLLETPEDTKPTVKGTFGSFVISTTSIRTFPECTEIGVAL